MKETIAQFIERMGLALESDGMPRIAGRIFGLLLVSEDGAERLHAEHPAGQWRQLGATYEQEPAMEHLMDHPSVLSKVRALLGDHFILQSSWCTVVPAATGCVRATV